jgi:DNA-binding XRE family transcriptional regulator
MGILGDENLTFFGFGKRAKNPSTEKCEIYTFNLAVEESDPPEFAEFDKLVAELEAEPRDRESLSEARKVIGRKIYDGSNATLAALRMEAGLSQRELGELCGLPQPHVSRFESGKHEPGIVIASAIAAALNVSLERVADAWERSRDALQYGETA